VGAVTDTFRAFDPPTIRAALAADTCSFFRQLTVLDTVDSTNLFLQRLPLAEQHGHAIVADRQESGRGRRGRSWYSPRGANIYLSLGWRFSASADSITRLPLAVAVCTARAIEQAGVATAGIKWPNDIQVDGKKLAGILLDVQNDTAGGIAAVIGVGVNVSMPADALACAAIEQAWADVCAYTGQPVGDNFRDRLCGMLLDGLLRGLNLYATQGFSAFAADWNRLDVLHGRWITIVGEHETASGTAAGISSRGGLLVQGIGPAGLPSLREYLAGEISVRIS
jgi:BirA family transcriptional regulator, biotin operon repressor / biotin---[acetyl-CoA-carboxylase] ligase